MDRVLPPRGVPGPETTRGDAVLLDLALGLDAVVILVLALDVSMKILF